MLYCEKNFVKDFVAKDFDMYITEIFLKDYRNIFDLRLDLSDGINIFLGRNAQGKTNILEAVYFSSVLRARTSRIQELVRRGSIEAFVKIKFSRADVSQDLSIEIPAEKRSRRLFLNGEITRSKEFIGRLNSVMFSPEDLLMLKSAPLKRRQFLDGEISQASPSYYEMLTTYNRLVSQRNRLLKQIRERSARRGNLEMWNEQLARYATQILLYRLIAVDRLNEVAQEIHRKISARSEKLLIEYKLNKVALDIPTNDLRSDMFRKDLFHWYKKNIYEKIETDIARGNTSFGPHLDDLDFFVDGMELKTYGSQGQLRTAALSLKLSELELLKAAAGEYPVLLLDDVMSELDAERREQLLIFLKSKKIQTIITATERKYFPEKNFGKTFFVKAGKVLHGVG